MRLREFIRQNRKDIDAYIDERIGFVPATASCYCPKSGTDHRHEPEGRRNDEERRQWILGDEYLYRSARAAGVPI